MRRGSVMECGCPLPLSLLPGARTLPFAGSKGTSACAPTFLSGCTENYSFSLLAGIRSRWPIISLVPSRPGLAATMSSTRTLSPHSLAA